MIIEEISQQDLLNASSTKQIWGITMSPDSLVTAVLGCLTKEDTGKDMRSLVYVNYEGNYILFCSLTTKDFEMRDLGLHFHGTHDMEFLVRGQREVSLIGYLYNCYSSPSNVITPPIITTEIVEYNEGEKRKKAKKHLPIVDGSDAGKLGNNGGPVGGTSKTTKTQTNDDKEELCVAIICALPKIN